MMEEPLTLYKLIILYMLNRVDFPLTNAQVGNFILEKEYTNFLTLQQAVFELTDAGLIATHSVGNRTHITITAEGRNTLSFFENRISDTIKEEIYHYLNENEVRLRMRFPSLPNITNLLQGNTMPTSLQKRKMLN